MGNECGCGGKQPEPLPTIADLNGPDQDVWKAFDAWRHHARNDRDVRLASMQLRRAIQYNNVLGRTSYRLYWTGKGFMFLAHPGTGIAEWFDQYSEPQGTEKCSFIWHLAEADTAGRLTFQHLQHMLANSTNWHYYAQQWKAAHHDINRFWAAQPFDTDRTSEVTQATGAGGQFTGTGTGTGMGTGMGTSGLAGNTERGVIGTGAGTGTGTGMTGMNTGGMGGGGMGGGGMGGGGGPMMSGGGMGGGGGPMMSGGGMSGGGMTGGGGPMMTGGGGPMMSGGGMTGGPTMGSGMGGGGPMMTGSSGMGGGGMMGGGGGVRNEAPMPVYQERGQYQDRGVYA